MVNKMDEQILVANRQHLFKNEEFAFQGVINKNENKHLVNDIIGGLNLYLEVMRRGDAEENTNYKQPIPYAVIKRENLLYGYTRLEGGGETRLHGKISLGLGGHMNPIDDTVDFGELILANLDRELEEEVSITSPNTDNVQMTLNIIGLINDDKEDVGKVHIGILAFIELPEDAEVTVNETEQLEGKWFTKEELLENYDKLENWSKFVVDTL